MRRSLGYPFVAVIILFSVMAAPVQADIQDQLLDALGEAKLGYQKDASDYIREAEKDKDRCEEHSRNYNEKYRAYILQVKEESGGQQLPTGPGSWEMLLSIDAKKRAELQETPMINDFHEKNPMARMDWFEMTSACNRAETKYNKAFELTRSDDYTQQARIFRESAEIYDIIGDTDGASQVREAETAAQARADAKNQGLSDCLIVTATFGSPMAREVQLVRDFRDDTIKQNYIGTQYVSALNILYYSFSPAVARAIDENPSVKPAMRLVLAPLIGIVLISQGFYSLLSFSPEIATVVFIVIGGALVGFVYLMPIVLASLWVAIRTVQWRVPEPPDFRPVALLWTSLPLVLTVGALLKLDLVAVVSSGLLFLCTAALIAVSVALHIAGYIGISPDVRNE